jgi:hypothetical protein
MNQMIRNTRQNTNKSLDKTSPLGRSGTDELVPSRYALRVGEIDVLVISDGVLTPPSESMATNADPAVRGAWLDDMFLSRDAFDWALNDVVVRSGDQTILIDSGLGLEYPDFPRAGQLSRRYSSHRRELDCESTCPVVLVEIDPLVNRVRFVLPRAEGHRRNAVADHPVCI